MRRFAHRIRRAPARLGLAGFLALLPAAPAAAQAFRAVVRLPPFREPIALDTIGRPYELEAGRSAVFHALAQAFATLKIRAEVQDSAGGLIGTLRLVRSGPMAGAALSRYLECGRGMMGPNADHAQVTMALLALFDPPSAAPTRIEIALVGSARNVTGNSTEPNTCLTTGVLEARVIELVRQTLAAR